MELPDDAFEKGERVYKLMGPTDQIEGDMSVKAFDTTFDEHFRFLQGWNNYVEKSFIHRILGTSSGRAPHLLLSCG